MAAKCYWIETSKEKEILVHKGGAKSRVTKDWFMKQYYDF